MPSTAVKLQIEEAVMSTAGIAARLHGEAIEQLSVAIGAIEAGDVEARCQAINLAVEMVTTLHLALDFEEGGETAERMGAIYRFVLASLFRTNIGNDAALAGKLINVLRPLHDAWAAVSRVVDEAGEEAADHNFMNRLEGASRNAEAAAL